MTGGRLRRLRNLIGPEPFMLTYGDGVCDLDLGALVQFHRTQKRLATVTAVRPPARFGGMILNDDRVVEFTEKSQVGEGWINGGFMVLERDVLTPLAAEGQLCAYRHAGFWQCMDTLRDVRALTTLWESGAPPWKGTP